MTVISYNSGANRIWKGRNCQGILTFLKLLIEKYDFLDLLDRNSEFLLPNYCCLRRIAHPETGDGVSAWACPYQPLLCKQASIGERICTQ